MSKWKKYRRIQIVDVLLFERPKNPETPPYPIRLDECACDAMDSYTCGQHQRPPRYGYHYRAVDRRVSIRPGEWLVVFNNGQAMTATGEELGAYYEPVQEPPR